MGKIILCMSRLLNSGFQLSVKCLVLSRVSLITWDKNGDVDGEKVMMYFNCINITVVAVVAAVNLQAV